jgi:hypothetical protein
MSEWLNSARELDLGSPFLYVVIGFTTVSVALLHCADAFARARARRRTARAIAQTRPPEAQTWEQTHSADQIKLHKESR